MVELNIVFGFSGMWELGKGKTTKRQFVWSRDISVGILAGRVLYYSKQMHVEVDIDRYEIINIMKMPKVCHL